MSDPLTSREAIELLRREPSSFYMSAALRELIAQVETSIPEYTGAD